MGKLTKAQLATLKTISDVNAAGRSADRTRLGTTTALLDRMKLAGLITSARPFAYRYHTVSITDAGRRALAEHEGEG